MAAFAQHKPSSQHVVLHAIVHENPERSNQAEWTESELAQQCAVLSGKPCQRQGMGNTLRLTLLPKGLVTSRKKGQKMLLWSPTAEASVLHARVAPRFSRWRSQGRRVAQELAALEGGEGERVEAARALKLPRVAPTAAPPQLQQSCAMAQRSVETQTDPSCDRCGLLLQLRCPSAACELAAASRAAAGAVAEAAKRQEE